MEIVKIEARSWTLPLRAPFQVAKRTAYEAKNALITVTADDGTVGHGGAAPVGYVTGESVESVITAVRTIAPAYDGQPVDRLFPLLQVESAALASAPSARAGVEMALLDLWAKRWQIPLWHFFGAAEDRLVTDLTIPIVPPEEAGVLAREAASQGFRNLKIKVGAPGGIEEDIARICAIAEAAPRARLRIDANQGFEPESAVDFARTIQAKSPHIDMIEQPVAKEDIEGLRYVKERIEAPVFADESAQSISHVRRLLKEDAVDGINIKTMKSGILGAWQIANLCRTWGKRIMIGCMLESRLGQTASCFLAAGMGGFDFIDLDAHRLLAPDSGSAGGFVEDADTLIIESERPGWGVCWKSEPP